jgi:hypothetical protein
LQEGAQPLALGRTILEILFAIDIDPEFVHEKLGEGAVAEFEDIPAAHGEKIVQQSHVNRFDSTRELSLPGTLSRRPARSDMLREKHGMERGMATLREMQEGLIRAYRAEIAKLEQHLARYEARGMRAGERKFGGPWVDVTDREIKSLRNEIANYERTITRLEKELGSA